jgi:uncharacterized protein
MVETDNIGRSESSPEDQPMGFSSGFASGEEEGNLQQPEMSQDARNMAMLCHVLGIMGFFAPLMIWLIERDKHRFVDEHGREAMNYQISMLIYGMVAYLSFFLLRGFLVVPALSLLHLVLVIIGATKAQRGEPWHYPIAITFLK